MQGRVSLLVSNMWKGTTRATNRAIPLNPNYHHVSRSPSPFISRTDISTQIRREMKWGNRRRRPKTAPDLRFLTFCDGPKHSNPGSKFKTGSPLGAGFRLKPFDHFDNNSVIRTHAWMSRSAARSLNEFWILAVEFMSIEPEKLARKGFATTRD